MKKSVAQDNMVGSDRVAAILLSLGKPIATNLLKHFEPDEIRRITRSAADLKPVSSNELRGLIEDFATEFALGTKLVGDLGEVQKLLSGVLPDEQVDEILETLQGAPEIDVWGKLSDMSDSELSAYVAKEHPQTAAYILSKVKSSAAAKVISRLPPQSRDGIFRRMIAIKPIAAEAQKLLERILQDELLDNVTDDQEEDGHARIAEIINKMDRAEMDAVMEGLEVSLPKVAESLKGLMFTFDDVTKLTPTARGNLFERVPADKLVVSLRGTEDDFRDMVLSSLSGRVRKMIEQELEGGQPVPARDVNDARRVVTDLALQMAANGEITIQSDEDDGEEEYLT